jgi:hypothetical protein
MAAGRPAVTPAGDRDTVTERLVSGPQALMRWASAGLTPGGSALGCLNPLTLFRFVLLLFLIALMPLYLLPMLVVRMATSGRTAVKYSATVGMTSGAPARWGYGTLDPPAAPAGIQAAAAAIAARDAGFDTVALMNWAAAATELICQSRTTGDATPARTFMAAGLFRSYQALLELRAAAGVSCTASWRATGATLAGIVATPLFDEVRVRLHCEGWCAEQHEGTGLILRGSAERRTWSEDLTFGRSAEATSPAGGGLPARRCPSCGAPLELDSAGACRYCRGIVTAGRHDWVLTGWRCEPW